MERTAMPMWLTALTGVTVDSLGLRRRVRRKPGHRWAGRPRVAPLLLATEVPSLPRTREWDAMSGRGGLGPSVFQRSARPSRWPGRTRPGRTTGGGADTHTGRTGNAQRPPAGAPQGGRAPARDGRVSPALGLTFRESERRE